MRNIVVRIDRVIGMFTLGGLILSAILLSTSGLERIESVDAEALAPGSEHTASIAAKDLKSLTDDERNGLAAAIRTARYSVERSEDKFHASNPANKLRAVFDDAGHLKLHSSSSDDSWQSNWQLKSIGHGSVQEHVSRGNWSGSETKISARHLVDSPAGPIEVEETFENRPDGLEQVFIVEKRPASSHADSALRLVLEIDGDLTARASDDGQTIDLIDNTGEKTLRYEKLKVWDANFRELNAEMVTRKAGEVWLEVEDKDAQYPITVDPSFVQLQKLTRPDSAAGDNFGTAMAYNSGSGILAIGAPDAAVGSNAGQGAVYIFQYSGQTRTWVFRQKITASDGLAADNFGSAVANWSNEIWVGAPNDNVGSNLDQGSVYKFELTDATGVWTQVLKVTATDGAADDNFGSAILVPSTFDLFVAAANDDVNDNSGQGSVYWINADTGGHRRRLNASDGLAGDAFGSSVDGWKDFDNGDLWLTVGARRDDNGSATDQGSVYILKYDDSSSTWGQPQKLLAPDGALGDNFGAVVHKAQDLSDDLYVGATSNDVGGNSGEGSVYYYKRTGEVYVYNQQLTASDGQPFDRFGSSIAIDGFFDSTLVVGSPFADIGVNDNQGAVYFFTKRTINGNVVFRQSSKRSAPDGGVNDHFGSAVILSSDRLLVVGSPDDDVDGDVDQGSVSYMRRTAAPFDFDSDLETDLSIFRPSNGQWWYRQSNFGTVTALQFGASTDRITPGDFTGDGKTDIAFWRPSTATWFVLRSEDTTFYSFPFGLSTDTPTVGDFDGDAKADAAVFRPSNGTWYISRSTGGTTIQQFGSNGDIPVVGDYDDDGRSDLAIFRPANGQWWLNRSSSGIIAYAFGNSSDKPVQADYTGDGKTDAAIFRPSNGFWYVLRSENLSFYSAPFGTGSDLPTPGDYDGDSKADLAVFRPSEGIWYLNRSLAGSSIQQFGSAGDWPAPNAFVP